MKAKNVFRYCFLLLLNTVPFLLYCFIYENGATMEIHLFPILQIFITLLNYKWTRKIISFLILNTAMLVSSAAASEISTRLYYSNISSDSKTLLIGHLLVEVFVIFVAVLTLIGIICRIVNNRRNK